MKLPLAATFGVAAFLTLNAPVAAAADDAANTSTPPASTSKDDRNARENRRAMKLDEFSNVSVNDAYRAAARQKRHESIEFLKDILTNRQPQGEQKAEMMLRLADLYFEEGRDISLTEQQKFQEEFDRCFNTPGCKTDDLKADETESRAWQMKSIKLYQQILANYPQYSRADEATFYLGSALQEVDEPKDAMTEFTKLVKAYPDSQFVPDAYVLIGEYYFDQNNAYKALLAYQKASAYKDHPKYSFAMYKLAWCYYNVGEYGKAIDTMKAVVTFSMTTAAAQQGQQMDEKARLTLQDEALKDLVRFFADAGDLDEAERYFTTLGKQDLIVSMLQRLAGMYFEQGKFEQCIQTYRRLITKDPNSKMAPHFQNEIVLAYQKMGKKAETIEEIERLRKTYGKNSAWARANAASPETVTEATDFIEKNLRTVAINYHDEAKKLQSGPAAKEAYALAYKAYTIYLQEFPTSKYSYDVRYAFGELLYKIKRYDEAYEQYMKVVEIDPKGQHSMFCADSAIFAAEEMVKQEKANGEAAPTGPKTQEMPLTKWEANLVKACDQYASMFPSDKKTVIAIYKAAYLLNNKNHFKEASDRFIQVIKINPTGQQAEQAANLILDNFNLIEDWKNLKEVSKAFYDQPGLGSANFKKETYNVYERASFKLIEVSLAKNEIDKAKAAEMYLAFYNEFPNSEVADTAVNNAAVYYTELNERSKALDVRLILINKFPSSKYYKDQVAAIGFDYETVADFKNAADWYEKLFSIDPKHTAAKEALYSSAVFRRAMGQLPQATADYTKFMAAFPDDDRLPAIQLEVAKIYEEQLKWDDASKVYFAFFNKPSPKASLDQVFFARKQYGFDLEKQNKSKDAEKHWDATLKLYNANRAQLPPESTAHEVAAQIMYRRAMPEVDAYMAMAVTGPKTKVAKKQEDEILKKQLFDKADHLQKVEKDFVAIIDTGAGEWGLASLIVLGKAYENMGDTLKNSAAPSYLNPDQQNMYKMAMEDRVFPQIEKAVEAYSTALKKSFDLSLYNDNTAYATRRLGELRPDDFPELLEKVPNPKYTSSDSIELPLETSL